MRVLVVDPSSFTLPYDHCLCQSLSENGCEVALVGSRFLYADWQARGSYDRWEFFYRTTDKLYQGRPKGRLRSLVKGIEHAVDTVRLWRAVEEWQPDIVHYQWLPLPTIDNVSLARIRCRCPVVFTLHNTHAFHGTGRGIQAWGFRQACVRSDHLVAHTEYTRSEAISRFGLPAAKISVIPMGVFDYYRRSQPTSARFSEDDNLEVLFFGVLKEYKGLDVLFRAFAALPANVRDRTRLRVAGYPAIPVEPYQMLAQRLGVADQVRWDLRFVPENEVASVVSGASVVCLPYTDADQSAVLLTAIAFDKPIVASRIGGFPETIRDGVHGYLVEPGDNEALSSALAKVLGDAGLRQNMSDAVHRLANTSLSWTEIGKATAALYRRLVAG